MDRHHRIALVAPLAAALLAIAACAPDTEPATLSAAKPARLATAADFEAAIARLEKLDPQSPQALSARLEYADFLLQSESGDCRTRLDTAQAQFDAIRDRPATGVVLPLGPARMADGEYKIHAGRAACGDPAARAGELGQALDAAKRATGLYRDGLDYQSAAIMQFNVAATEHQLGETEAANSALEAAIAMDREFGFQDDAQDNNKTLLKWRNQDDSDAAVTALMEDFPARSAELKFDWSGSDADLAIQADDRVVTGGKVIRSRGAVVLKRHVSVDMSGTNVTYEAGTPDIVAGDWSGQDDVLRQFTAYLLGSALLGHPNFEVHRSGDFEFVRQPGEFGQALSTKVAALLGSPKVPEAEPAGPSRSLARDLKSVFSGENVQTVAIQKFDIETATWAGAKLQQGEWYKMSAALFLPGLGMGQFLVDHDIEFSFTRQLPCAPGTDQPLCVEIVVHATPDPGDLMVARTEIGLGLKLADPKALRYWSTTNMRLVVKPDTLVPYICDTRRYWYIALDGANSGPAISSESVVETSTYH